MVKKIFLGIFALLLLFVFAAIIFVWQFDIDDYRQDLEKALADALGVDVNIAGGLSFTHSPQLNIAAKAISMENEQLQLIKLKSLNISSEWRPLLNRILNIKKIHIDSPHIELRTDESGNLILPVPPERPQQDEDVSLGLPLKTILVNELLISNLSLQLSPWDNKGAVLLVEGLTLSLKNLMIAENESLIVADWPNYLQTAALTGNLEIQQISLDKHSVRNIRLTAANEGPTIRYEMGLTAYGGTVTGTGNINWQPQDVTLKSIFNAKTLLLSEVFKAFALNQRGEGIIGVDLNIANRMSGDENWVQNLATELRLDGEGLVVEGLNVDLMVSKLIESQKLNFTDVGGFALAGPLALLVTKGSSYTGILQGALTGETNIPALVAEWHLADQQLLFSDVALATEKNRLALTGHIDLAKLEYGPLNLYALNAKGCQLFKQQIKGPVSEPELGAVAFAASSVLNPLISIAKQGRALVTECKPVYEGEVAHPEIQSSKATANEERVSN